MSFSGALFLLAFSAGSLLAIARHPIFGLATYVAVFYLNPPARWWGQGLIDIRWSLVAAGVTLIAVLIKGTRAPPASVSMRGPIIALVLFVAWLWIQSFWAVDIDEHRYFLSLYAKFPLVLYLMYRCIDSEAHLKVFLWAHVLGCFYMGWIAYTSYSGGRFEEFGMPGLSEANAAALQMVTGVFVASALFLRGGRYVKAALLGVIPFILNGIVATVSRSAFLAIVVGGAAFTATAPRPYRKVVNRLSVLAVILFLLVAGSTYWNRIESIKYRGQEVEGVDTGASRLAIMRAQVRMIQDHPFGCGHQCTAALSPLYIEERFLSRFSGQRGSHNTFMSTWLDHGLLGAFLYVFLFAWGFWKLLRIRSRLREEAAFLSVLATAVTAAFVAILVSDQFVPNTRLEARIWFIGLVLVMTRLLEDYERDKAGGGSIGAMGNGTIPRRA